MTTGLLEALALHCCSTLDANYFSNDVVNI